MLMLSPLDIDLRVAWHREELLGEAAAERLAAQVRESRPGVRPRLAAALHALADRLDTAPYPSAPELT